jgi:ABC-type uncharacterized transport system substrate-binding protein
MMEKIITFYNPENIFSFWQLKICQKYPKKLDVSLENLNVKTKRIFLQNLKDIKKIGYNGIFVIPDPIVLSIFTDIINISNVFLYPFVYMKKPILIREQLFLSYGIDLREVGKQAFTIVKILNNFTPEKLPIFVPEKINLVVNNKWAKEKGG